MQNIVCKS